MRFWLAALVWLALPATASAQATCRVFKRPDGQHIAIGPCKPGEKEDIIRRHEQKLAIRADKAADRRLRQKYEEERARSRPTTEHCYYVGGKLQCKPVP